MKILHVHHHDHGVLKVHLDHAEQILAERGLSGFFVESIPLPPDMPSIFSALYGPTEGDAPVPESRAYYTIRGERTWASRLINNAPRPARFMIVVGDTDAGVLYTAYGSIGGAPSPREPGDTSIMSMDDLEDSREFWSEHALTVRNV